MSYKYYGAETRKTDTKALLQNSKSTVLKQLKWQKHQTVVNIKNKKTETGRQMTY